MARTSEIVGVAVEDLRDLLKEIEDTDDGDLSEIAQAFDKVGEKADKVAAKLQKADDALNSKDENEEESKDESNDAKKDKPKPKR